MADVIGHVLLLYRIPHGAQNARTIEEKNMIQQMNDAGFRFRPAREEDTENVLALYLLFGSISSVSG